MIIQKITLEQILAARERRAAIQESMLSGRDGACLVCLTLNIAGEIKRTPMTRLLFRRGVEEFEALGATVLDSTVIDEATGTEAFWLISDDAQQIKARLEAVEDSFPAARLFDFDVLVKDAEAKDTGSPVVRKLSREGGRSCLICGGPAAECARSRRHGLDAIREATGRMLRDFCADRLADAAYDALLDELFTTPKPGLVDLANCGAHTDMDIPLFERSAESLRPYLRDAAMMGMRGCSMRELRERGIAAEKEMFEATGGVNTHKGMIYSVGLILAGAGMALSAEDTDRAADSGEEMAGIAVRHAAELARQDADRLLSESLADPRTNGGSVLKAYGAKGAMGHAAAGFPDAVYCASRLRFYRTVCESNSCLDGSGTDAGRENSGDPCTAGVSAPVCSRAGVLAFCDSMARLEDTNLLHRGGRDGLDFARSEASRIAAIGDLDERIRELTALDAEMISRGLSPGGSADMLALAYLLETLRSDLD